MPAIDASSRTFETRICVMESITALSIARGQCRFVAGLFVRPLQYLVVLKVQVCSQTSLSLFACLPKSVELSYLLYIALLPV